MELPTKWDGEMFSDANRKLWLAVGTKAQTAALDAADVPGTIRWAQLAETAYWQATGEGDCHSLNSLAVETTRARHALSEGGE